LFISISLGCINTIARTEINSCSAIYHTHTDGNIIRYHYSVFLSALKRKDADIFSDSEKMKLPKFSKSKFDTYDDMINLMCVFSVKQQSPVYYRLLPGKIKDVGAFKMSLQESGVKDTTMYY